MDDDTYYLDRIPKPSKSELWILLRSQTCQRCARLADRIIRYRACRVRVERILHGPANI